MDFTDVALTALQVVSPVLVAALTWAAAKLERTHDRLGETRAYYA